MIRTPSPIMTPADRESARPSPLWRQPARKRRWSQASSPGAQTEMAALHDRDRHIYQRALDFLRPTGLDVDIAAYQFAEAQKILGPGSVIETARFFAQHQQQKIEHAPPCPAALHLDRSRPPPCCAATIFFGHIIFQNTLLSYKRVRTQPYSGSSMRCASAVDCKRPQYIRRDSDAFARGC
jgi:hypothetical protein